MQGPFCLEQDKVVARLIVDEGRLQGTSGLPEEPMTWTCRSKEASVLLDVKLNVLSSQFTNGLFRIVITASDTREQIQVCGTVFYAYILGNYRRDKVC